MTCVTNADCAEISTGCCLLNTITAVADGANWGAYGAGFWGATDGVAVVGETYGSCSMESHMNAVAGTESSVYVSTAAWLANITDDEAAAFDIYPEDTVDDLIAFGGADAYTFENTFVTIACEGAAASAISLRAAWTAVVFLALLN